MRPPRPLAFLAGAFLGLCSAADAFAAPAPLRETSLVVGLARGVFTGLNENDAVAAYRTFITAVGRRRGYEVHSEILVFDTVAQFEQAVRAGRLHLIVASTWQYLSMNVADSADIEFVAVAQGVVQRRLLLLVHRGADFRSIADLRGGNLLVLQNSTSTLGLPWLDSLGLDAGIGRLPPDFASLHPVTKPSAAILPVFFGRADACVVDDTAFAVTCELNPQIGRDLVPLARSAPLLDTVVCLSRLGWPQPEDREDLRRNLRDMHLDPTGRQILSLFKADRLVPFEPPMLDNVVALQARLARPDQPPPRNLRRPAATGR